MQTSKQRRARIAVIVVAGMAAFGLIAADAPAEDRCHTIAGQDEAAGTADDVQVCTQDVWFHRAETPVGNLGATDASSFPTWDTTAPEGSYTEGSGGAYAGARFLDLAEPHHPAGGATFEGTFNGVLDTIAVTVFHVYPDPINTLYGNHTARLKLTIDGAPVYQTSAATGDELTTTSVDSHLYRTRVAFTDLHEVMSVFGIDPAGEHTIELNITPQFLNTDNTVYVYDAAEIPSGMTFNPPAEALAGFTQLSLTG